MPSPLKMHPGLSILALIGLYLCGTSLGTPESVNEHHPRVPKGTVPPSRSTNITIDRQSQHHHSSNHSFETGGGGSNFPGLGIAGDLSLNGGRGVGFKLRGYEEFQISTGTCGQAGTEAQGAFSVGSDLKQVSSQEFHFIAQMTTVAAQAEAQFNDAIMRASASLPTQLALRNGLVANRVLMFTGAKLMESIATAHGHNYTSKIRVGDHLANNILLDRVHKDRVKMSVTEFNQGKRVPLTSKNFHHKKAQP